MTHVANVILQCCPVLPLPLSAVACCLSEICDWPNPTCCCCQHWITSSLPPRPCGLHVTVLWLHKGPLCGSLSSPHWVWWTASLFPATADVHLQRESVLSLVVYCREDRAGQTRTHSSLSSQLSHIARSSPRLETIVVCRYISLSFGLESTLLDSEIGDIQQCDIIKTYRQR